MIASLAGTIAEILDGALVLDIGGIGYQVAVLPSLLEDAQKGKPLHLLTHLQVREDELALYGFSRHDDLRLFRMLIEVPGVGPKSAMSILASAGPEMVKRAVAQGELAVLTRVSGVGRKTAERIVTELRSRLARGADTGRSGDAMPHAEVMDALTALGYTRTQARDAVRHLPADIGTLENGVRAALQILGQRVGERRADQR